MRDCTSTFPYKGASGNYRGPDTRLTLEEVKSLKNFVFEIQAKTRQIKEEVQIQLNNLTAKYGPLGYTFMAHFGDDSMIKGK